ncbi:hypothetical protein EDB85DRAFT_267200 [Lactarius pseudohatsudake]|nr:hypothetical protein EDB85DRAFT_267200 [Lactarius pseudohatsudake]
MGAQGSCARASPALLSLACPARRLHPIPPPATGFSRCVACTPVVGLAPHVARTPFSLPLPALPRALPLHATSAHIVGLAPRVAPLPPPTADFAPRAACMLHLSLSLALSLARHIRACCQPCPARRLNAIPPPAARFHLPTLSPRRPRAVIPPSCLPCGAARNPPRGSKAVTQRCRQLAAGQGWY